MEPVTVEELRKIIETDLPDADLQAYIDTASIFVNEVLSSTSISDFLKTQIAKWFAAHLLASTREQQLLEASAGSASAKFQAVIDKGLESTMYGQQVLTLDTTGTFAKLGKRKMSLRAIEGF